MVDPHGYQNDHISDAALLQDADLPDNFEEWVRTTLYDSPLAEQGFGPLIERIVVVVIALRQRLDKEIWLRLLKGGRMFKELNEVLPVVARVLAYVEDAHVAEGCGFTFIDLCSGIGYLSIILAELLQGSSKVARFTLVDKGWPLLNREAETHHINPMHLQAGIWPFELTYRKYDIKSSSGHRQLQEHIVAKAPGPVILLGVHLCGVLSLHAVQFFNDHPRCTFLALKPCCLPPLILAKQKYVWTLGGHSIDAGDVCAPGKYSKGKWTGPQRKSSQRDTFKTWTANLFESVDVGEGGKKELANFKLVHVPQEHFLTLFAFASRPYQSCLGVVSNIGGEPSKQLKETSSDGDCLIEPALIAASA